MDLACLRFFVVIERFPLAMAREASRSATSLGVFDLAFFTAAAGLVGRVPEHVTLHLQIAHLRIGEGVNLVLDIL
jgi:hypothetical protein